jgi:hypothetical protein
VKLATAVLTALTLAMTGGALAQDGTGHGTLPGSKRAPAKNGPVVSTPAPKPTKSPRAAR